MPIVERTMTVAAAPDQVINYLKDFANSAEWDSGTQRCTRNGSGLIEPGASWQNVSKIFGFTTELTYTLEEASDRTLVFVGTNDASTTRDTITVDAADAGSVVTYRAELTMHGAAKLLTPVMNFVFDRLASDTEKQLTEVLNGLAGNQ
jgi:carbon monoxide dehydrogenase subunit G